MQIRWLGPVERFANHPAAPWLLAAIAFADSSFLPIPPDLLLVPMVLIRPARVWSLSILCTAAAGVGAVVGYIIGAGFWHLVGEQMVAFYGWTEGFAKFQSLFNEWGVWIIIFKAFTPIPFKIAAIAAGLAGMDIWVFLAAALVSRGLHFLIMALLLVWLGPRFMEAIERYETRAAVFGVVAIAVTVVYIGLR
jgi:membrane protein YqaA with SNARE-associated domain